MDLNGITGLAYLLPLTGSIWLGEASPCPNVEIHGMESQVFSNEIKRDISQKEHTRMRKSCHQSRKTFVIQMIRASA